jgi:hypothetical protein
MKITHTTAIRDAARDVAVDTSQPAGRGAAACRHHGAANDSDRKARRMKPSADLTSVQLLWREGLNRPVLHPARIIPSATLPGDWGLGLIPFRCPACLGVRHTARDRARCLLRRVGPRGAFPPYTFERRVAFAWRIMRIQLSFRAVGKR